MSYRHSYSGEPYRRFATANKDPDSVLPYSINWASEDGTNDGGATDCGWLQGDTIITSSWALSGPDSVLVIDSDSNSTTGTTVVLSGGTVNLQYMVTNHITTAAGYQDDRSIHVKIAEK